MTKDLDLLIIGAGPAGLSAAINGASEGLKVGMIDAGLALGGQAKESRAIENYPMPLGFDTVTGDALTAGFVAQAVKFGVEIMNPVRAQKLVIDGAKRIVMADDFQEFAAKSLILAPGLSYRRHNATGLASFMGKGVSYGMPGAIKAMAHKNVVIVGGANSAGQAAVAICRLKGVHVTVVARRPLAETMSDYLIARLESAGNVEIKIGEIEGVTGSKWLEGIVFKDGTALSAHYLIFYIGAVPMTAWLEGTVELDDRHFIVTGPDRKVAPARRPPLAYETSMEGVFAAGDVRSGSTKRIVNAVGEGGAALQNVHAYLRY